MPEPSATGPRAPSVEAAPADLVRDFASPAEPATQEARDDAEIAAFAAAQPAAKARAAMQRALAYATATCVFVFFATVAALRWLRASLPYLRVVAANARTCLAAEWVRAKEHATSR